MRSGNIGGGSIYFGGSDGYAAAITVGGCTFFGDVIAFISGNGSLKPPSSVLTLLMTLGGREPSPAAGIFKQMLVTFFDRFVTLVRCCWMYS